MTRRSLFVGTGLALASACTPQLEPIRWDALDVEELRDAIANPTGIVDEASADEIAGQIVRSQAAREALTDYLHWVFLTDEAEAAGPAWVVPQALDGTSVYVIVACPGPAGSDDPPFSHGSMRIDSPTLDAEVVSTYAIEGQLHLTFTNCVIDRYVFDGAGPAFHSADPGELGVVPALEVVDLGPPEDSFDLTEPVILKPAVGGSVLFELSDGETLALDWSATQIELSLRGINGALICTIVDQLLECVPP